MRPETIALSIPIIAIVLGIGLAMLALFLKYKKRREMFALYHQERLAALDKGQELTPLPNAFFSDDALPRSPHRFLLRGLVLLFLGVALGIALHFNRPYDAIWLWGLLPTGVGLAYLIYYFTVGRREAEAFLLQQAQSLTAAR